MKRVELLIEEVRELTGNQRYDANSGHSQYVMVRALKNAQIEMYKNIVSAKNEVFKKDGDVIPVVSGQSLYSYPDDIYLMNIETMLWSNDQRSFVPLHKGDSKDNTSLQVGYPFSYVPRGNGFLLVPPVGSGYLKPSYIRRIPDLEKRSGCISAVTVAGSSLSAITLDAAEASFDSTYLNKLQKLCVVDKFGVLKAKNIEFTSVNSSSGVVTLSAHTLASGEAVAVGDYVTAGPWTYNTSELPDICEPTILKYAQYQIEYGDASKWSEEVKNDMTGSFTSVIENLLRPNSDFTPIAITNIDYL